MPLIGTRKFPKGPNLRHLERHDFNLSGTRLTFSAPEYYHDVIAESPSNGKTFNLYDERLFGRLEAQDADEPPVLWLQFKRWRFKGIPLIDGTGVLGDMTLETTVSHMPEFESLFRPRHMEGAIERHIYSSPNSYKISGECRQRWTIKTINDMEWISYQSTGYAGFRNAEECYETVWHTPITDQHLLTVRFDQVIRKKRTRLAEVYEKIIDLVMGSVKIQLSSDAKAQQAYIKQLYPDERLSEYLPPYQFEEIELLEELDLINLVSAENNHDLSIPDDIFDAQVQQKDQEQRRRAEETRSKILASHLRFKAPKEDSDPLNGCR